MYKFFQICCGITNLHQNNKSTERKITAASLRGKYKDIPVSSYELMREKREEVEREEQLLP
jgi:hypothetical protein